jgi:chemotaxis protein MotA
MVSTQRFIHTRDDTSGLWLGILILLGLGVFVLSSSPSLSFLLNIPSLILVVGGTIGATLLTFPSSDLQMSFQEIQKLFTQMVPTRRERIERIILVSKKTRREGMLVLEREAANENDMFFKQALSLAVDERDPSRFQQMLYSDINVGLARSERVSRIIVAMAQYAPAVGFIGTLLGLLEMLGTLGDAAKVGPAMALALMTTLYGSLLAQLILIPLAGRIRTRCEDEVEVKEVTVVGLTALIQDENPVVIQQQLAAFLPR